MQINGIIKRIDETKEYGSNNFKKRIMILETEGKYPQPIPIEFVQDKVGLLDDCEVGDTALVDINLRGRHYDGRDYVSVQGWKITMSDGNEVNQFEEDSVPDQPGEENQLPF